MEVALLEIANKFFLTEDNFHLFDFKYACP